MDAEASMDENDVKINISLNLKIGILDLPPDYAANVIEPAVEREGSLACAVMNIVIFVVGSRGGSLGIPRYKRL
jgi:hypothetical protein